MKKHPRTSTGAADIDSLWNDMDLTNRKALIEILIASLPESEQTYIATREHHPVFSTIDMKKNLEDQAESEHLRAALRAVFLNSNKEGLQNAA